MRKTAKKTLCMLLVLGMLFPLAACTPTTPPNTTTDTVPPTTTGPIVTTDPHYTDIGTLSFTTVNDLSEYTIVLSSLASVALRETAASFAERLAEKTGVTLPVVTDTLSYGQSVPVGAKEILLGDTNRSESFDSLRYNDFLIEKRGSCVVIAGGVTLPFLARLTSCFRRKPFLTDKCCGSRMRRMRSTTLMLSKR